MMLNYDSGIDMPLSFDLNEHKGASCEIYLCIAANERVSGINGYLNNSDISSWCADYIDVPDQFDHDRVREVMVAKPNLLLLSQHDSRDQYFSMKDFFLTQK